eukprot:5997042-Prymnesium_polylepis.1
MIEKSGKRNVGAWPLLGPDLGPCLRAPACASHYTHMSADVRESQTVSFLSHCAKRLTTPASPKLQTHTWTMHTPAAAPHSPLSTTPIAVHAGASRCAHV